MKYAIANLKQNLLQEYIVIIVVENLQGIIMKQESIKKQYTEKITRKSLNDFGIPYDSLNLHVSDKLKFFKENKIDLCIEDSYETCRELTDNGIKSILMTTKMNADINDKEIVRVNNWNEIYDEVEKYKNNL